MVELQRGSQIKARARSYHRLSVGVRLGERGSKVDAGAGRIRGADSSDGNRFPVRGGADGDLVAHDEAVHVADFHIGRASTRISREIRVVRLRADARDRDGLDPMADAVDVQPDLVADRDVGDRRHLDTGCAGGRVRRQVGLRARLADRGHCGHLVLLQVFCDGGIGGAIADGNLLADHETGHARYGHVGRADRDRDHRTIGERLPQCRMVAGCGSDACDLASLQVGAGVDANRIAD